MSARESFSPSLSGTTRLASGASRPSCSSWLEKKAEWRTSWDARFFTLDGHRLEYRITEATAPKKCGTVVSLERLVQGAALTFRVWLLEGGSWMMRAKTAAVYDQWVNALEAAVHPPLSLHTSEADPSRSAHSNVTAAAIAAAAAADGREASTAVEQRSEISSPTRRSDGGIKNWDIQQSPGNAFTSRVQQRHTDPHGEIPNEVLLTAVVEKQAAWTLNWNPRVIELREGCQLVYRVVNGDAKQRFFVVGIDRSPEKHQETHALFSTSTGETFWVNFHSVEECEQWSATVREEMKLNVPWHWFPIQSVGQSGNLSGSHAGFRSIFGRLMEKRAATSAPLHVQYHCSALFTPSPTVPPSIVVFGGATEWIGMPSIKKWGVPMCPLQQLTNSCVSLSLRGNLKSTILSIEPYAEQVNVKAKPPMLYGATMSMINLDVPIDGPGSTAHRSATSSAAGTLSHYVAVVLGGFSGISQLLEETEVWGVHFPFTAAGSPFWQKWVLPSSELPPRAFHSTVTLQHLPLLEDVEAEFESAVKVSNEWVLLTGGVDHDLRPVQEVFLISWIKVLTPGPVKERVRCIPAQPLPSPRAFHGSSVLSDGTVVVVGGRGCAQTIREPILVLRPPGVRSDASAPVWTPVVWADQPLPPLPVATASVTPSGQSIVVLAQLEPGHPVEPQHGVRLYVVHFECGGRMDTTASWEEIPVRMGMVPKRVSGCTIHVHDGYVYVLGAAQLSTEHRPTLCGPLRVLMG